jgi:hypothetical protein
MLHKSIKQWPQGVWLSLWLTIAVCLFSGLYQYQISRACWLGEWPFETGCKAGQPTGFIGKESADVYEQHLIKNPGNSWAYLWLAVDRWQQNNNDKNREYLNTAMQTAPLNQQMLLVQADLNLKNQEWPEAAQALVKLLQLGNKNAREPFLQLLSYEPTRQLALNLITADSFWLDKLLRGASSKLSINVLLPAFSHGKKLGLISADTTVSVIDKLMASGQWFDAYSMWVEYHGTLKNGLYNTGFDTQISQKGFDWKWSQSKDLRKSMLIRQVAAVADNGMMLELEFFGRKAIPLPIVHQVVILQHDDYVFSGSYYADKLQANEGLSWKFSCASGSEHWAQTDPLLDTQKQWKSFELKLKIPASCNAAVLVGLETKNAGDARTGITGLVQFDRLSLNRVDKQ